MPTRIPSNNLRSTKATLAPASSTGRFHKDAKRALDRFTKAIEAYNRTAIARYDDRWWTTASEGGVKRALERQNQCEKELLTHIRKGEWPFGSVMEGRQESERLDRESVKAGQGGNAALQYRLEEAARACRIACAAMAESK